MQDDIHNINMTSIKTSDLERVETMVSNKVSSVNLNELLEGKANKNSVASALQRKANKSDLENIDTMYVNLHNYELVNEQFSSKLDLIESKLSYLEIDSLKKTDRENLIESIEYKLDINT